MSNLIVEIGEAEAELARAEVEASEAGRTLRQCQRNRDKALANLRLLLAELISKRSRYPLFERLEVGAEPEDLEHSSNGNGSGNGKPRRRKKPAQGAKGATARSMG